MGGSIGDRLKALTIFFSLAMLFLMAFTCCQTVKVNASANLTAYLTVPPTDWEPGGYNTTGTTEYYIVHSLGWTPTSILGNVGIGDGSERVLNNSSNQNVNYTANNFMAADISMAPLDSSRLTSATPLYSTPDASSPENQTTSTEENTTSNSTAGTNTTSTSSSIPSIPEIGNVNLVMPNTNNAALNELQKISFDNNNSLPSENESAGNASGNTNTTAANSTTSSVFSNLGPSTPLNDAYHSIIMGRPVDDLLYEYPLATSVTMYARLVGLPMPCGSCANIGIRCLGYGY